MSKISCIRLDIKTKHYLMESARPSYLFYKASNLSDELCGEPLNADTVMAMQTEYKLYRLSRPDHGISNYLISDEDKYIIDDLVSATRLEMEHKLTGTKLGEQNRIKQLPWWRRLFNKF